MSSYLFIQSAVQHLHIMASAASASDENFGRNEQKPYMRRTRASNAAGETYLRYGQISKAQTMPVEPNDTFAQTQYGLTATGLSHLGSSSPLAPDGPVHVDNRPSTHDASHGSSSPWPYDVSSVVQSVLTCKDCSVKFTDRYRKRSLDDHRHRLHKDAPYQCHDPSCQKTYKRAGNRLRHHRKHESYNLLSRTPRNSEHWNWGNSVGGVPNVSTSFQKAL